MKRLLCFFGVHDMKVIRVNDKGRNALTTQKCIVVQCTVCKETFQ